ncbi:MAG: UrcA family protein [Sphingomonadales bacterium]|nr:UrcA family protein [Sphingomonadales bacterium]
MFKKTGLSLAAAITILVPAAAHAQNDSIRISVQTGDLDLRNAKDQMRLTSRIKTAAKQICGSTGRSLIDRQAEFQCRDVITKAVQSQVVMAATGTAARQAMNMRNGAAPKA